ncbi:MAG: hypothetical protein FJ095_11925 [Deltaproteobacteria bacterium]|nr:hypothetical protein [Deltaproteobacteria bacterium]
MPSLAIPTALRRTASALSAPVRGVATFAVFAREQLGHLQRLGDEQGDVARFEMLGAMF